MIVNDRILEALRAIVQAEARAVIGYPATYEYSIDDTDGTTVDASPTTSIGLPSVNKVPLRSSTIGSLTPITGKLCHIVFANGDLRMPVCTWCEPTTGPAVARVGDTVNAGYLVVTTTPPGDVTGYFPGTTAGLAAATAAAAALVPPGLVVPMASGAITSGSLRVTCE